MISRLLLCLCFLQILACSTHKDVVKMPPPASSDLHSAQDRGALGTQLTSVGGNEDPAWHPSEEKILFVSGKRQTHRSLQVYEMQISNEREKRITYQNGDCREPQYVVGDNADLFYVSTTDEAKERPLLFQKAASNKGIEPSFEIYRSSLTSENIDRLTQRPGFDGLIAQGPEKKLNFASNDNGVWTVREWTRPGVTKILFNTGTKIPHLSFERSSNKWAWTLQGKQEDELFINKTLSLTKAEKIPLPSGRHQDIQWVSSQSLLLASDWEKKGTFQIYLLNLEKKCLGKVFETPFSVTQPALSPKQKKLLYVGTEEQPQIFLKDVDLSQIPCSKSLNPEGK